MPVVNIFAGSATCGEVEFVVFEWFGVGGLGGTGVTFSMTSTVELAWLFDRFMSVSLHVTFTSLVNNPSSSAMQFNSNVMFSPIVKLAIVYILIFSS